MSDTPAVTGDNTRSASRRAQILEAAADCFRNHGFHGASIAQISKAASMSPGHIYHYFNNKEAIIEAIVALDLEHIKALNESLLASSNVLQALLDRAEAGVTECLDPRTASLKLEILAEAARNPQVANIVQESDKQCIGYLNTTVRTVREACNHEDSAEHIEGLCELIAALFEGLTIRAIRNPNLNTQQVTELFRYCIRNLLAEAPGDGKAGHPPAPPADESSA